MSLHSLYWGRETSHTKSCQHQLQLDKADELGAGYTCPKVTPNSVLQHKGSQKRHNAMWGMFNSAPSPKMDYTTITQPMDLCYVNRWMINVSLHCVVY